MLKKIKRGVKKIMEKGMELAKAVIKGLTNTRNRANFGFMLIGLGGLGLSCIVSAYLENGCHLYPQETETDSEE